MKTTHQERLPQDKICGYEYTVRRGDSFYLIANRLGISLRDLLEANSGINPARLTVGDVLCIPMEEDDLPPQEEAAPLPPVSPVPDDQEAPDLPEIPQEEPLPEVLLPENEDLDAPAAEGAPDVCPQGSQYTVAEGETIADVQLKADINRYTLQSANPTADLDALRPGQVLCVPSQSTACPPPDTYILQAEETLESAALRLNQSLAALLRANPCLAPSDFTAGQCVFIP